MSTKSIEERIFIQKGVGIIRGLNDARMLHCWASTLGCKCTYIHCRHECGRLAIGDLGLCNDHIAEIIGVSDSEQEIIGEQGT